MFLSFAELDACALEIWMECIRCEIARNCLPGDVVFLVLSNLVFCEVLTVEPGILFASRSTG